MRWPVLVGLGLVAALLGTAGCGGRAITPRAVPVQTSASSAATAVAPPPEPVAVRDGACPYLRSDFVADTNGQRVGKVRLSADRPHPACFFYRADGGEQLRVEVLVGVQPAAARAAVDRAAPVASSDPATLPGGWQGGKQPTDAGAVFAVAKDGSAVVVVTNQKQTIKASRIAEQAITALGL
jgi:hypothetical protein